MISRMANAVVFAMALAMLCTGCTTGNPSAAREALPSWKDGPAKQAIVQFVQKTTDRSGSCRVRRRAVEMAGCGNGTMDSKL